MEVENQQSAFQPIPRLSNMLSDPLVVDVVISI